MVHKAYLLSGPFQKKHVLTSGLLYERRSNLEDLMVDTYFYTIKGRNVKFKVLIEGKS